MQRCKDLSYSFTILAIKLLPKVLVALMKWFSFENIDKPFNEII
jgi:hypothetical protein